MNITKKELIAKVDKQREKYINGEKVKDKKFYIYYNATKGKFTYNNYAIKPELAINMIDKHFLRYSSLIQKKNKVIIKYQLFYDPKMPF